MDELQVWWAEWPVREVTAVDGTQAGGVTAGQGFCWLEIMGWGGDDAILERQGLRRAREGWRGQYSGQGGQQAALPWTGCSLGHSAERLREKSATKA